VCASEPFLIKFIFVLYGRDSCRANVVWTVKPVTKYAFLAHLRDVIPGWYLRIDHDLHFPYYFQSLSLASCH